MRWFIPFISISFLAICSFLLPHIDKTGWKRAESVSYFSDDSQSETAESIQKQSFQSTKGGATLPLSKTIWLKIRFPSDLDTWNEEKILFTGSNEAVLSMTGFIAQNEKIVHEFGICDAKFHNSNCELPTLQYAFPLPSDAKEDKTIYLKLTPGAVGVTNEFYFMKKTFFSKVTLFLTSFVGIAAGIFLFVGGMFAMFSVTFKEPSFLIYGLFYLNLFVSTCINRGLWDLYRPDAVSFTGSTLMFPASILTVFFDLLFINVFFEMQKKNIRLNFIYKTFLAFTIALIALHFIPEGKSIAWSLLGPSVFASIVLVAATLIYFIWQKRLFADLVAMAWGLSIVCSVIWTGYRFGVIEGFWFFGYYAIFGRILEAVILNGVLFRKINGLNLVAGASRARLEESAVVKTLLRTLSHDLSSTIQIISSAAKSLDKNPDPQNIKRRLDFITTAVQTQSDLIANVKKTYLVRGKQVLNLSPVDLNACIEDTLASYRPRFESKGVELKMKLLSENILIYADKVSLCSQVLGNIISNALKFTRKGKTVTFETKIIDRDWLELKVIDEGVGIPPHILDRLFDDSESISQLGTDGEVGTGTGLLILKDFVSWYGATLDIRSRVSVGTSITIHFKRFN